MRDMRFSNTDVSCVITVFDALVFGELLNKFDLNPVYTIQPVVKSNRFDNRFDKTGLTTVLNEQPLFVQPVVKPGCTTGLTTGCIHDTAGCQTGCQTGLTTGWMFVYTIQPVVKRVWQPVWQQVVSCKRGFIVHTLCFNKLLVSYVTRHWCYFSERMYKLVEDAYKYICDEGWVVRCVCRCDFRLQLLVCDIKPDSKTNIVIRNTSNATWHELTNNL